MLEIEFVPPPDGSKEVFTEATLQAASTEEGHFFAGPTAGTGSSALPEMQGVPKTRARSAHKPFEDGNRLPVPREVSGHHFFYKVRPVALDAEDVAHVLAAAKEYVRRYPLGVGDIGVLRAPLLGRIDPRAADSFERLIADMGVSEEHRSRAAVLACHWSAPHVDEGYQGYAFLSYVLHTGPSPYVVQTFHMEAARAGALPRLTPSSRLVNPGDFLMLDPTTAHMAAPSYPGDDHLLVMIQIVIDETCLEDRLALLEQYPPADGDENVTL